MDQLADYSLQQDGTTAKNSFDVSCTKAAIWTDLLAGSICQRRACSYRATWREKVYTYEPETLDYLKANIHVKIAAITLGMLQNIMIYLEKTPIIHHWRKRKLMNISATYS